MRIADYVIPQVLHTLEQDDIKRANTLAAAAREAGELKAVGATGEPVGSEGAAECGGAVPDKQGGGGGGGGGERLCGADISSSNSTVKEEGGGSGGGGGGGEDMQSKKGARTPRVIAKEKERGREKRAERESEAGEAPDTAAETASGGRTAHEQLVMRREMMCCTIAGNRCEVITITEPRGARGGLLEEELSELGPEVCVDVCSCACIIHEWIDVWARGLYV